MPFDFNAIPIDRRRMALILKQITLRKDIPLRRVKKAHKCIHKT